MWPMRDAFDDGRLKGYQKHHTRLARGYIKTTREDLRSFATESNDGDLLAFLKRWDKLNLAPR
jgi:hypothetical protein